MRFRKFQTNISESRRTPVWSVLQPSVGARQDAFATLPRELNEMEQMCPRVKNTM